MRKTPSRNSALQDHEDNVLRSLRRIFHATDLYSRQLRTQCELTIPQLMCLREVDRTGVVSAGELARSVSLSPATVSGILDRLELRGLLTRQRPPADKRRVLVTLTAAGRRAVRAAPTPLQDTFTRRFRALSLRKQALLDRSLRAIVAMMEAGDFDAAPVLSRSVGTPRGRGGRRPA